MKQKQLTWIILFFLAIHAYGQTKDRANGWADQILRDKKLSGKEYKKSLAEYDFGPLWTNTDNSSVLGFIGRNYQRIRVKIISAAKDKDDPDLYAVSGKSMIRNNILAFSGTIKILNIRAYKRMHWGVDDEYKNKGIKKQGVIIAEYRFAENKSHIFSGIFEGRLATYWYIDRDGKLRYDDIEKESDSYHNNQFAGTWRTYRGDVVKNAGWGDHRIPLSGDLDAGAGEFSPADEYLPYGWQTYRDAYFNNDIPARREEERLWWK